KDVRQLLESRDEQKKIQDRIGKDTKEMLQKDVDRIRQALRDNKLPRSTAHDMMDNVARALQRVTADRLNRIQELLDRTFKDEDDPAEKRRSRKERTRDLTTARRNQEEVQKTFDGLLSDLNPYVTVQEMQGKAQALLRDQEELAEDTRKLREEKTKLEN